MGTRLVELMDVAREGRVRCAAALLRRRVLVPAAGIALGATMVMGGTKLVSSNADGTAWRWTGRPAKQDGSNRIVIGTRRT
ncbi:MAG: hypothetical protein U0W40_13760 [Acidimicrobiia bacterium]